MIDTPSTTQRPSALVPQVPVAQPSVPPTPARVPAAAPSNPLAAFDWTI